MFRPIAICLILNALGSFCVMGVPLARAVEKLDIGSVAPALAVEHWVQNGNGKYSQVSEFAKGKVYVVEFWATTCGPCIQSMPHLASMQTKFADKGLQIISISNEPLSTVTSFLTKKLRLPDGKETTINDVTRDYCLTTDPDGSSEVDYLLAAEQDVIPTAFVVGKDAKIEWIGNPIDMETVVEAVLHDQWDRAAYISDQKLIHEAKTTIGKFYRSKHFAEAAQAIDGFIGRTKDKRFLFDLYKSRIDMQLLAKSDQASIEKSYKALFEFYADEPLYVQDAAWGAFEKYSGGELDSKSILDMSADAVQKGLSKVSGSDQANMYDTLARLQFTLERIDQAIASQTKAIQLSDGSDQGAFKEFLTELHQAKEKK